MTTADTAPDAAAQVDQRISSAVKQLLATRDLTVADLSYNAGIPMSTVYRKLNGTQTWKSSDIYRVALYLGVSPNDLFSGKPVTSRRRTGTPHARKGVTRK